MKEDDPIDIMQQFVDLYAREQMLCFFDFALARPGKAEIAGLCRISEPKENQSSLRYLSMVFVVDTPDAESRSAVSAVFARLEGDSMKALVAEIAEVLAVPAPTKHEENYVHQIDVLLDPDTDPDERFVSAMLLPAVRTLTGLRTSELVWWGDDAPDAKKPVAEDPKGTFLDGLRRLLDRPAKAKG